MESGRKGEEDAAYLIDFALKDSQNYAIVHDLRLEHNGRVAQIDHLLVGRFFDIILIESKNIGTAMRVNAGGEFEVRTRFGWRGMASPVEQSKRHEIVLDDLLRSLDILPSRLGFRITPTYHHWVLVPPECNFTSKDKSARIVKRDLFAKELRRWVDENNNNPLVMAKLVASQTLATFAEALIKHHRPLEMDYQRRFGITTPPPEEPAPSPTPAPACCEACSAQLEPKVAAYCKANATRFHGKLLCRECQKTPPATKSAPTTTGPCCAACGCEVDSKVVAFCRFNSRRFGKRTLCRECQATLSASPGS